MTESLIQLIADAELKISHASSGNISDVESWLDGARDDLRNAKAAIAARATKRELILVECLKIQLYRFKELLWRQGDNDPELKAIKTHNIPMIERVLIGGPLLLDAPITEKDND